MRSLFFLLTLSAANAATTATPSFAVSTIIPDNNIIGVADSRTVTTSITEITSIEVAINLTGGWNGDLYAYLSYAGGFAILLNRPGRSQVLPDGSGSSGMAVIFSDAAAFDIHTAIPSNGMVVGLYQPDGRNVDPANSLDTTPRSAFLGSFAGINPNGEWTLYIADASPGGVTNFQSWSLAVTGVPEPSCGMLIVGGAWICLRRRR